MNTAFAAFCIFIGAFALGSIPWGFIAGRLNGIDIRTHGSGNIGATNVFRVIGKGWGITVFVFDFLKGFIAALGAGLAAEVFELPTDLASILGGLGAILGHNFTPWLGFRGGKGIASSAGVLFGITPIAAAASLAVWIVLFFTTRYVSVSSIGAAVFLPLVTGFLMLFPENFSGGTLPLMVFSLIIATLAVVRHRSNIERLLSGTEPRMERKSKQA